jgi:hypothetical protein
MTPLFALLLAGATFWTGVAVFGWQFITGVIWLFGVLAYLYWYAFGEVKP